MTWLLALPQAHGRDGTVWNFGEEWWSPGVLLIRQAPLGGAKLMEWMEYCNLVPSRVVCPHTHTEGADTFLPDRFVNALLCLRAMRCVLLFLDMNTI